MHTTALFIIDDNWKQSVPLKDEWSNKLIRNYYYSAVKRSEILLHTTCIFLWGITLNETKKQKQKTKLGVVAHSQD